MRVIAGKVKGKKLATLTGSATRPTSDRVREALFSILYSQIGSLEGKSVLDLFAGSGAISIEALSRGAKHAWMVEKSRSAAKIIEKNLISCQFSDHADIVVTEVSQALKSLMSTGPFDLIFLDPPYRQGDALKTLQQISAVGALAAGGLACAETDADEELPDQVAELTCTDRRRYGSTMLHFYTPLRQDMS